jgi:hypothetical protein
LNNADTREIKGTLVMPMHFYKSDHDDDKQCAATPEEIYEGRRKCWATDCKRRAILEWCGWRWCLRHYWANKGWGSAGRFPILVSVGYLWANLRFTRIIWRIRR